MNEVERDLYLIKMAAVWHFAHAIACLVAILVIIAVAAYIHISETNSPGPGERTIVGMIVKDALSRSRALDSRRRFALCFIETLKRRLPWTRSNR